MKLACVMTVLALAADECDRPQPTADEKQRAATEQLAAEAQAQVGMPAIKNFRERKLLKDILELRDQEGLVTYTYIVPETTGIPQFLCVSIGYGIPYSAQFTNPDKIAASGHSYGYAILPQPEPNGIFSPGSAEGTWVLCQNPSVEKHETVPVYVEPRILVSPFRLDTPKD